MIDEFDLVMNFLKVLDMPPSVVGAVFGAGMWFRSKRRDKKSMNDRSIDLEVGRQMDYLYSKAYKAMEDRVYYIHSKGEKTIEVRSNDEIIDVPLNAYKTGYKDALKEVAFKIVKPCIIDKLHSDKAHYNGKHFSMYVVDTGEDIRNSFTSSLGRKTGITEFSNYIEEDVLNEKVFQDLYSKIIRRVREQNKKIF